MKRTIWLLLLLLIGFSTVAQEKKDSISSKQKRKKFAIGFSYEPKYCYRTNSEKKSYFGYYSDDELYESYGYNSNNEIPKKGYTTGITFSFSPIKYIGVNLGIMYSTMGYKTKTIDSISIVSAGVNYTGNPPYTIYNYPPIDFNYAYISIPIIIDFVKHFNKLELHIGGGANFNFLKEATANKGNIAPNYPAGKYTSKVKNSHLIYYNLHLGCNYDLNKRFMIGITPNFSYQKESLNSQSLHLFSIGAEIKFSIKL